MASPAPLVDTNIVSELSRPRPNDRVVAWAHGVVKVSLSIITLEEIQCGLAWKSNARVQAWFEAFLQEYCDLQPITAEIAARAGRLRGSLAARGVARTRAHMLIAATAQVHGLTLVTRNVRDFAGCGIALLDPFK